MVVKNKITIRFCLDAKKNAKEERLANFHCLQFSHVAMSILNTHFITMFFLGFSSFMR